MGLFNFARKGKIEYIIAGLGNPGAKYAKTRHNAGFMALDLLAEKEGFEYKKLKFRALVADEIIGGKRCLIMKPQTMMNLSGEAVLAAAQYYNIPDEKIIIIYDDVSLDVGKIRVRRKGSAGGHNGIKSIISCLGSEDFPRVKIGVGKKPTPEYDMISWVLGEIESDKKKAFDDKLNDAVGAAEAIIRDGVDSAMNEFNS
ncbi:MAG: aminoacyl-tRNA hydrolase [Eubacterium sp.]|nr:aminoacyl-tRNA hydrolase [Eubacterium sp.]